MNRQSATGNQQWTRAALALGVVLRSVQYFSGSSFWYDEVTLALNVEGRSLAALLFLPLDERQVAPAGFLAILKACQWMLGSGELVLRLLPWLASLGSLWLFWRVARYVLDEPDTLLALTLFAGSPALIWYAGNLKPYSSDVAATLMLAWLTVRAIDAPHDAPRAAWAALGGAVAMFVSYPAIVTGAVLALLVAWRGARAPTRPALLAQAGAWLLSAALAGGVALALLDPETSAYMQRYWSMGFLPEPLTAAEIAMWVPQRLLVALAHVVLFDPRELGPPGITYTAVAAVLTIGGAWRLARRRGWVLLLIAAPLVAAVTAAVMRVLPFHGRVSVFVGWCLVMMLAAGLGGLARAVPIPWRGAASAAALLWAAAPAATVLVVARPPYHNEDARSVLRQLADKRKPGDAIYVYYGAVPAMRYYGAALNEGGWTGGGCHRDTPRAYLNEVDAFRGQKRVWFVYTHAALGFREPEAIGGYLEAIGIVRDRIADVHGLRGQREASAALYDLSDPVRLATASADRWPMAGPDPSPSRTLCDGTRMGSAALAAQPRVPILR